MNWWEALLVAVLLASLGVLKGVPMTRDSKLWWLVVACSVITAVASRMDYIDRLLPAVHTDKVHAIIELLALIAGIVGGFLYKSPLDISDAGRAKYLADRVKLRPLDGDD